LATYAYFGGRIEAPMQGKTRGRLFSNDISSAYPAQIAKLPSMAGGQWRQVFRPTREQVFSSSMLSESLAKTRGFPLTLLLSSALAHEGGRGRLSARRIRHLDAR
jgi:hypothetical protein